MLFRTCGNLKPQPVVSFTNRVLIEHVVRERRLTRSKFVLQWESIDEDVNTNIFDTGIYVFVWEKETVKSTTELFSYLENVFEIFWSEIA